MRSNDSVSKEVYMIFERRLWRVTANATAVSKLLVLISYPSRFEEHSKKRYLPSTVHQTRQCFGLHGTKRIPIPLTSHNPFILYAACCRTVADVTVLLTPLRTTSSLPLTFSCPTTDPLLLHITSSTPSPHPTACCSTSFASYLRAVQPLSSLAASTAAAEDKSPPPALFLHVTLSCPQNPLVNLLLFFYFTAITLPNLERRINRSPAYHSTSPYLIPHCCCLARLLIVTVPVRWI